MATVSAGGNYTHYLDVTVKSQDPATNRTLIHFRRWYHRNIAASAGSWSGSSTRKFGTLINGVGHDKDITFDTRSGNDWTVVEDDQWVTHDADGTKTISFGLSFEGWSSSFPAVPYTSGSLALPRIAKPPAAPTPLGLDQVTSTSMRYRFQGNSNGGAAVDQWQFQYATSPTFSDAVTVSSTGTSIITGLRPGTLYYFRARGHNTAGWGSWSAVISARTLAGAYVGAGTAFPAAEVYVGVGGQFVQAGVLVGKGGSFVSPA